MTLATQLEKIASSGLIRLAQQEPEPEYIFRHALVQDATYESLLRADRRSLHSAVGHTLESLYPERLDEIAATLALHFERADEYEKAVQYLVRAGEAAARVYAIDEAVELFGRALKLIPATCSENDLTHLYDRYGHVLELAGRFEAAIENYNQMRAEAAQRKSLRMELLALMACGVIYSTPSPLHDTDLARELSEQAIKIARALGDWEAQSRVYWILMLAFLFDGYIQESMRYGEQSLEIAREINDPERMAFTLNDLAHCYSAAGLHEKASVANLEARLLWEELGNIPMLVDNLNTCAENLFMGGKLEEALTIVRQAYDMAHSIQNEWGQVFSLMITAMITSKLGDITAVVQAAETLFALDPHQNFTLAQIGMRGVLADLYMELGQTQQASEVVFDTYQFPEGLKPSFRPPILACRARLALRSGNLHAAEKLLDQALEDYDPENFVTFSPFYVALAQAEIHMARGEPLKAQTSLDDYIEALYSKGVSFDLPEHLLTKAQIFIRLKRKSDALALLQEMAPFWTPLNFRRSLWKIYALMGQLQNESGHFVEAQQSHRKAREYLEFLVDHAPVHLREVILQLPEAKTFLEDT